MSAEPDGLTIEQWLSKQAVALWPRLQEMFGPAAVDGWEVAGVIFLEGGPKIGHVPELGNSLLVVLGPEAKTNRDEALFQFSHEMAHCLFPMSGREAPMIEEGCCVKFSLEVPTYEGGEEAVAALEARLLQPDAINYSIARMTVDDLLAINPDAIRNLRAREPNWNRITPLMILEEAPSFPPGLAILLCEVQAMKDTAWASHQVASGT